MRLFRNKRVAGNYQLHHCAGMAVFNPQFAAKLLGSLRHSANSDTDAARAEFGNMLAYSASVVVYRHR